MDPVRADESIRIVTLSEAKETGSRWYFTGKPCKHGHVAKRYILSRMCAECGVASSKRWQSDNYETMMGKVRQYRKENPDKCRQARIKWERANPSRVAQLRAEYRARNIDKSRAAARAYQAKQYATVVGNLNRRMAAGIYASLGPKKAGRAWETLVGYDISQLRAHLERQFTKGMSWENRHLWHVDHILPLSSFVFSSADDPEFRAAWAITNLRPLWASRNISKGAKMELLI